MQDETLHIRLTKDFIEDMLSFHGMNIVKELKDVAHEQMVLNHQKTYVFDIGTMENGRFVWCKTLSPDQMDDIEKLAETARLADRQYSLLLEKMFDKLV